jgi:putative transposase
MPRGLVRIHESRQSHFVTFSCYPRQANFSSPQAYDLFVHCLEQMRRRFEICVYGYVVMPEHVHLLINETGRATERLVGFVLAKALLRPQRAG